MPLMASPGSFYISVDVVSALQGRRAGPLTQGCDEGQGCAPPVRPEQICHPAPVSLRAVTWICGGTDRMPVVTDRKDRHPPGQAGGDGPARRQPGPAPAPCSACHLGCAARLTQDPGVPVPLAPDRIAVQVQHQVLPVLGAQVLCLPRRRNHPPGGRGRRAGGGAAGPAGSLPAAAGRQPPAPHDQGPACWRRPPAASRRVVPHPRAGAWHADTPARARATPSAPAPASRPGTRSPAIDGGAAGHRRDGVIRHG